MKILGFSAYYHDSAACLINNGEIVSAVQEERFTRIKNDMQFPLNSIKFCLQNSNINANELDFIVFYDKPFLKFERILETYLAFAPLGLENFYKSLPIWIKDKLFQKQNIINELEEKISNKVNWNDRLVFSDHHLSHAASAFFPSPYEESAILTMDGVGEWSTTSTGMGAENNIQIDQEIFYPHSIGLLYSAFTYFTGFKVNSGEYKLMGLAPYGQPKYENLIKDNLIDIKDDGSFRLNMDYFNFCTHQTMVNKKFSNLFDGPPRKSSEKITDRETDLAASIQKVVEDVVIKIARNIKKDTKSKNLCMSGGVALNCVANGKLLRENIFDNIWIQPASGDAGSAIGAALEIYYGMLKNKRTTSKNLLVDSMKGSFLGPQYSNEEIIDRLKNIGAEFEVLNEEELIKKTADELALDKLIGWFQGRMEFGPRALGARSILADPRSPNAQKDINLKIKYRESFRPFAPSVLEENARDWFELDISSPYMLFVANVCQGKRIFNKENIINRLDNINLKNSLIPAVTHVDFSARIQTINKIQNPLFHKLVDKFKEITGVPLLVNTSFNVRGEPIVNTPEEAFTCFMGTELDSLVIGNCYLKKKNQKIKNNIFYKNKFDLD